MDSTAILQAVADGALSVEEASRKLAALSGEADLGFARVDLDREARCGLAEVVFGEGKEAAQIVAIMNALRDAGQAALVTRVHGDKAAAICAAIPDAACHDDARAVTVGPIQGGEAGLGCIAVVSAGTSDLPVVAEAALTAEWLGARVERFDDVGVAGLSRLLTRIDAIRQARVVVVVAGMDAALPSVVAGQVSAPIIAVPTSVGYGWNLHGVSALLSMLNSCSAGVTVVNIDNGFGAGVAAAKINRLGEGGTMGTDQNGADVRRFGGCG